MIEAEIIADSVCPEGIRLISIEVTMARYVLAEMNTHRMFARNSASSRAIPVSKNLKDIKENIYYPIKWGKEQKGMQSFEVIEPNDSWMAFDIWKDASEYAIDCAEELVSIGVHKQFTNRLLEPFMYHTMLITATDWQNFFNLRLNADAAPDIQVVAEHMLNEINSSKPVELKHGEWHLPYVSGPNWEFYKNYSIDILRNVSVAKCARLSYLNNNSDNKIRENAKERHEKMSEKIADVDDPLVPQIQAKIYNSFVENEYAKDIEKDLKLVDQLSSNGHMSPFEHVATPFSDDQNYLIRSIIEEHSDVFENYDYMRHELQYNGPFRGWNQFRKYFDGERIFSGS